MTRSGGVRCRLSVPAELEAVRETARLACRFFADQNVDGQDLIACELALVEACNNAVAYSQFPEADQSAQRASDASFGVHPLGCQSGPPASASHSTLNDGHRTSAVEIELCCDAELVEMHVIDHGPGFDWPERIELPEACEEHGRGLFIIKSLMHYVFYLRGSQQNRLIMRMRRHTGEDETNFDEAGERSRGATASPSGPGAPMSRGRGAAERLYQPDGEPQAGIATPATPNPNPPRERLAAVEQKLALSEHVIGTMAKEICFRSEELAAIFRSTSELGGANNLEAFSDRLLNDLLHLTGADWFVLRLLPKQERKLTLANISRRELALRPLELGDEEAERGAEAKAARSTSDVPFGENARLAGDDPLAIAFPGASGIVKPILMGDSLLGTLAIGRGEKRPAFLPTQLQVIQTFSEFLAIQLLNIRLHQEHLDHRLTARELDIARSIQQSLLPRHFPKLPGYSLSGFCINARQVGGDFFDVLPLNDDKVLLVIADVMGKGVPAALFAATLHTLTRAVAEWTHRPAEILERVNRLIYEELSGVDMFITAQVVVVDARKRRFVVANAGHCPLLLTHRDGTIETLSPEGIPLGIMPDATFEHAAVSLADFTSVILYTDGLTEARNVHGDFFGQERFFQWLKQKQGLNHTAEQLCDAFRAELKVFQGQISLSDDQTFLVLAEEIEESSGIEEMPEPESTFV